MDDTCDIVTLRQLVERRPFLTERWVRSLVASGAIPARRLGGRLLFRLSEVDAAVAVRPTAT